MLVLPSLGDSMSLLDQPNLEGAFQKLLAKKAVLVCDHCARVQGGLPEYALEEQWTDQATYLTARGVSYGDVWWYHTTCQTCERSICRQAGCDHRR